MKTYTDLLHQKGLKNTPIRERVLLLLNQSDKGLTQSEIQDQIPLPCNRSSLFRTLQNFEKKAIIHKIVDDQGVARYAFGGGKENNSPVSHAHFYCIRCKNIFCLDYSLALSQIPVQPGFQSLEIELQIKGICKNCLRAQS